MNTLKNNAGELRENALENSGKGINPNGRKWKESEPTNQLMEKAIPGIPGKNSGRELELPGMEIGIKLKI